MAAKFNRIIMVVVDGLGIGSAPDAAHFADQGADTLGSLVRHFRARLQLPVLTSLGLGELHPLFSPATLATDHAYYGQARPAAIGKTGLEGAWELLGVPTREEFTAFPQGFPPELLAKISRDAHRPVISNQPATPVRALANWGDEQVATGGIIIFTSGGSDLWLTAHEATMTAEELWEVGYAARRWLDQQDNVNLSQVIAVPFAGDALGRYVYRRTAARVLPMAAPRPTVVTRLKAAGIPVQTLSGDDTGALQELGRQLAKQQSGLWLTHLGAVDRAGRQRDPERMGQSLQAVDRALGELLPRLDRDDLLLLTATHGNDPDFPGGALTREWVPLLAYSTRLTGGRLADRASLADTAALILENFDLVSENTGNSFLTLLK
ncbi:phosphopentomutase [Limosilactobacillus sp.]|uniref:phosphopentomutase n=1 Tax=Limosilactobacillus sp. TaxID=2773925 RepID=UPI003F07C543